MFGVRPDLQLYVSGYAQVRIEARKASLDFLGGKIYRLSHFLGFLIRGRERLGRKVISRSVNQLCKPVVHLTADLGESVVHLAADLGEPRVHLVANLTQLDINKITDR